jgi:hypothetical protein
MLERLSMFFALGSCRFNRRRFSGLGANKAGMADRIERPEAPGDVLTEHQRNRFSACNRVLK